MEPDSDCLIFEVPALGVGVTYGETTFQFKAPCFNPNNNEEFVYIYENKITGISSLEIYNLTTKEKKVLVEDNVWDESQPTWGINNKIAFIMNNQVFWINSDGTDLLQLGNDYRSHAPEWIYQDSFLTFTNYWLEPPSNDNGAKEHMYQSILSSDGTSMDSFTVSFENGNVGGLGLGSFNNNSRLFARIYNTDDNAEFKLGLIDIQNALSLQTTEIPNLENQSITCVQWHPNFEDIYFSFYYSDFYKFNLPSGKLTVIMEACDSKWYDKFSFSQDGEKVLMEKVCNTFDGISIWQSSKIVLMNIDGTEEEIVLE